MKLGFHINRTGDDVLVAFAAIKPAYVVMLDPNPDFIRRMRDIRPDVHVTARLVVEQGGWQSDPERRGRAHAEEMLRKFEAFRQSYNGERLINSAIGYNEAISTEVADSEMRRYDALQVAFGELMLAEGIDPIAFNFATGNLYPDQYLRNFPDTLELYTFLGFHEYDWPHLFRLHDQGVADGNGGRWLALRYQTVMKAVREKYGKKHLALITELGLTHGVIPTQADVGWRSDGHITAADVWRKSYLRYAEAVADDDSLAAASVFVVGAIQPWDTFESLGDVCSLWAADAVKSPSPAVTPVSNILPQKPTAAQMRLDDFPRPPEDNGRGVHWSTLVYHDQLDLDMWIERLSAMKIKWVKFLDDGGGSGLHFAKKLLAAGMMPVVRLYMPQLNPCTLGDRELATVVRYVDAGVRYFESNNEPDLPAEWRDGRKPENWLDIVVNNFIHDADAVLARGGLLALPAMGPGSLVNPVALVVGKGRRDLFERGCWIAVHNYTLNHPLDYPFDAVNQSGEPINHEEFERLAAWQYSHLTYDQIVAKHLPITQEEYNRFNCWAWDGRSLEQVNTTRAANKNPGHTLHDDANCFLGYRLAGEMAFEALGFHVPVISTEGGPVVGWGDDNRYPKMNPTTQATYQLEIARHMQSEAPSWYFACCTWLLAARQVGDFSPTWEQMAWHTNAWDFQFGLDGVLPVVQTLIDEPSLARVGTEDEAGKEEPVPDPVITLPEAVNDAEAYGVDVEPADVEDGQHYWKVVKVHHLTPEENNGNHNLYIDILDATGVRVRGARASVGWANNEGYQSLIVTMDKPADEPGGNVTLWTRQVVDVKALGLPSDRVTGITSAHSDEGNGNTWHHHSFLVVFQQTEFNDAQPQPSPLPIPRPSPERLKIIWKTAKAAQVIAPNGSSAIEKAALSMGASGWSMIGNEVDVSIGDMWIGVTRLAYNLELQEEAAFFATNSSGEWVVTLVRQPVDTLV